MSRRPRNSVSPSERTAPRPRGHDRAHLSERGPRSGRLVPMHRAGTRRTSGPLSVIVWTAVAVTSPSGTDGRHLREPPSQNRPLHGVRPRDPRCAAAMSGRRRTAQPVRPPSGTCDSPSESPSIGPRARGLPPARRPSRRRGAFSSTTGVGATAASCRGAAISASRRLGARSAACGPRSRPERIRARRERIARARARALLDLPRAEQRSCSSTASPRRRHPARPARVLSSTAPKAAPSARPHQPASTPRAARLRGQAADQRGRGATQPR